MKNFTKFMSAALLAAASLSLSGCQDEDFGFNAEEISFRKSFKETFGDVDPGQTWCTAVESHIIVNVDTPSDVYVYTTNGKEMLARYRNVSGEQTIAFDADYRLTSVMVTDGRNAYDVKIGGRVDFGSATRAGHYGTTDGITVSSTDQTIEFGKEEATEWQRIIPEIGDRKTYTNLGRVTQNFKFKSTGPFVIYPVYWQTSATNELGIYWEDENGDIQKVPVYTIKSGDELMQNQNGSWNAVWNSPTSEHFNNGATLEKAQGIKVDIPVGMVFGMYLHHSDNVHKFYSEQDLNVDYGVVDYTDDETKPKVQTKADTWVYPAKDLNISTTDKACHAATFMMDGKMYLGFEDWGNDTNGSDFDLNDCVFRFAPLNGGTSTLPQTIDLDASHSSYWFAYEDLGGTFDMDFNDIVLKVDYLPGDEEATVSLMAAGGTLDVSVKYDGTSEGETVSSSYSSATAILFDEVHAAFATANNTQIATTTPVNVNASEGRTCMINPEAKIRVPYTYSVARNRSHFVVNVTNNGKNYAVNVPLTTGETPQGIVIKATQWEWPDEMQPIGQKNSYSQGEPKYPEFPNWVNDHNKTNWYGEIWNGSDNHSETVLETPDLKAGITGSTIGVGDTLQVYVKSSTTNPVSVTSSNVEVMTIELDETLGVPADWNHGKWYVITANKPGKASFKMTAAASEYCDAIDEKFSITVAKSAQTLTVTDPASYQINLNTTDNKTATIVAETTGDGTISFSDGNLEVATVNASTGEITAVGPGETMIEIKVSESDLYLSDTKYVKVIVEETRTAATITSENTYTLKMGTIDAVNTLSLSATVDSEGALTYISNNTNVVAVDASGNLTAVGAGTATVTIKAAATDTYKAVSKDVAVTVTSAALTITSDALLYVEANSNISATYTKNGDGAVTFESSNTNVATVDNEGNVIGVAKGTATITATVAPSGDYAGMTATFLVKVYPEGQSKYGQTFAATLNGYLWEFSGTSLSEKVASGSVTITITGNRTDQWQTPAAYLKTFAKHSWDEGGDYTDFKNASAPSYNDQDWTTKGFEISITLTADEYSTLLNSYQGKCALQLNNAKDITFYIDSNE